MTLKKTRLSERLNLVYENLIPDHDVWDFCCDHGYLGGAAYSSENFKNIYFVDQVPALIANIKTKFEKFIFNDNNKSQVFFLAESGQNIQTNVFGSVSITGVGAQVICQILSGLLERKILKAQRLILGPHRDTEKLIGLIQTSSLFANYALSARKEITENGRLRVFFIYDLLTKGSNK